MKHLIIGTAGHIDHGKTALVRALTGRDCDRFPEEKARGITIDIGFASLDTDAARLSFIDVPGHERFVKNMLAGVWGIDSVLLVVAADESVMPQTREHFDILRILGVRSGLVVITKTDLVDEDMVELVRLEVLDLVRGSFLEGAPVLPVSSRTAEGIDQLKEHLVDAAADAKARSPEGLFRLYVDRSFTIKGHGTVVTGTVAGGAVQEGEEVILEPQRRKLRVRGVEVHGAKTGKAEAGQRAALNLQGIEVADATRGHQLLSPRDYQPTYLLNARLSLLASAGRPLKANERIRFHHGTSEILGRLKLLGCREIPPGGAALVQLRLEAPTLCFHGDRFVIRRYSPMITIGGGEVIDGNPAKIRGSGKKELEEVERFEQGDLGVQTAIHIGRAGTAGLSYRELLGRCDVSEGALGKALLRETENGAILSTPTDPPRFFSRETFAEITKRCLGLLQAFHKRDPLRWGMSKEELREKTMGRCPLQASRLLLDRLRDEGVIEFKEDEVRKKGHEIKLTVEETRVMELLDAAWEQAGMNPPGLPEVVKAKGLDAKTAQRVFQLIQRSGKIVAIGQGMAFHQSQMGIIRAKLLEVKSTAGTISVGQFKEMTGTTRKYAIPLLEYLDRERWTRREPSGDRIILLNG